MHRLPLYSLIAAALLLLGAQGQTCEEAVTQLPSDNTFNTAGALANQGEKRQAVEDLRDVIAELPGGDGVEDLTISTDAITPTKGVVRVDTESAASTDDLETINVTNHPDGRLLLLNINDSGRHVVLKHLANAGATGDIDLSNFGALDLELNNTSMFALVQRRGSLWLILDVWGREDFHELDASGEPALQGNWTQGTPVARFWRDATADVRWEGSLDWSGAAGGPFPSPAWTMPAGYRPASTRVVLVGVRDIGGTEDPVLEALRIEPSGAMELGMANIGSFTGTPRLYLDGVTYRAEQ